ncbi:MAG: AAA family ATPase [Pirellulales bacterium]
MRITALTVDGFGVWSGLELGDLSDQLNVFYGPNEAGKTTLLQFVRSVFFGFSPERQSRYLPPLGAGRPGGTIRVLEGDAQCSIARHADEHGEADGLVIARGTRRALDGEKTLAGLLGDVDEPTFNNVFVFGLREIQELATLGDTRAAEELYNLALGLDRVSLVDVLGELTTSRERLLAGDDRPSLVTQLLGQRERLQGEIDELRGESARYLALASERQRLDAEIGTLDAENARWEEQARGLALARAIADRWQRRRALDEQLSTLVGIDTLPENALARFEALDAKLAALGRRMRRMRRLRRKLRGQVAGLKINDGLRRQALRLEALAEQQHWIASLEKQVTELENEVAELELHCEASKQQWGAGAAAPALSKRAIGELRGAGKDLRASRHEAHELRQQTAAAQQTADALARRIDEALGAAREKGLTGAMAEAGQLVSELRRRVQLDERIGQLASRETELEEQSQDHLENQMLPTWALAGLGGLFVLGCALVLLYLAGLVLPASLGESLTWPVGLVGVGAAAAAGWIKFSMERGAEGRLDRCHEQISLLGRQIDEARAERDELDARLPRGGGPLVARLQAAEKSLARLEDLLPLQTQRESAERNAETVRQRSEALRDRSREARSRWKQLLAENRLPAELTPRELKSFALGRREVAGLDATLADKRSELGRRRLEYETLAARITQLVGQSGIAPRSQRPLDQLEQCLAALAEQQLLHKQRSEAARQIARLRRRYRKTVQRRNRLRQRRLLLMRAAGTLDELEFRRRAALQADASRLKAEHAVLDREISSALAAGRPEQQVAAWLSGGENLEAIESHVAEKRRASTTRLSEARERRGELNHRLKLMAEDRRLSDKRIELDVVGRRLADALRRWRVLAVCGLLLEAVREFYEREHQPQALCEASGYLKRLTSGRYGRVWTPLSEHSLRVDDDEGRSFPIEVLSSGTREQLFLALRLALASSYARRGVELPLVLDDVLVNFDTARAKAAALVLRDFAKEGHQILIFTCHEHIARLFKHVKAEVRDLPDHGNAAFVEKPPAGKSRGSRETAPREMPPEEPPQTDMGLDPALVEVEPSPASAPRLEVPPPKRRRAVRGTEPVRWEAEEFDGELSDRVRPDVPDDDGVEADDTGAADETQAA